MDVRKLAEELKLDPLGVGYASMQDGDVAAFLNAPDREEISVRFISKKVVAKAMALAALTLHEKTEAIQRKWDRLIMVTGGFEDEIDTADPVMQRLILEAVNDGVFTSQAIAAMLKRRGTRAEKVLGVGVTVTHEMIADARRSALWQEI